MSPILRKRPHCHHAAHRRRWELRNQSLRTMTRNPTPSRLRVQVPAKAPVLNGYLALGKGRSRCGRRENFHSVDAIIISTETTPTDAIPRQYTAHASNSSFSCGVDPATYTRS